VGVIFLYAFLEGGAVDEGLKRVKAKGVVLVGQEAMEISLSCFKFHHAFIVHFSVLVTAIFLTFSV
jgi:hypothetical protein